MAKDETKPPCSEPVPDAINTRVKKGLLPRGRLGIVCRVFLLLSVLVGLVIYKQWKKKPHSVAKNPEKAAAELFVDKHPYLEKVSHDDGRGEMTIRIKGGDPVTMSYKDIASGKMKIIESDGKEVTLGSRDISQVPSWVPLPPNYSEALQLHHSQTGNNTSGLLTLESKAGAADLNHFYEIEATKPPFTQSSHKYFLQDKVSNYERVFFAGKRSIEVVITGYQGRPTQVNISYAEE